MSGPEFLNARLGETVTYTVSAVDPDGDPFSVWIEDHIPGDFNNKTLTYTWTPHDMEPFTLM